MTYNNIHNAKEKLISKFAFFFYYGPLAQLVRALACHARGRRFEPDMGRQKLYESIANAVLFLCMLIWLRRQSTSLVRTRSPVRIWLSAPATSTDKLYVCWYFFIFHYAVKIFTTNILRTFALIKLSIEQQNIRQ